MRKVIWFASVALASFILGGASSVSASDSTIYCKRSGNIWDAFSEEGHFKCAEALMGGDACFVGRCSEIIARINNLEVDWDGEWLDAARCEDPNSLVYTWFDGPSDRSEDVRIDRCSVE